MTERFIVDDAGTLIDMETRDMFDIVEEVCPLLNKFNDENGELKFERDRYKRLSEIRQESINNRILTIKEFIDNCSDKKVKKTLEQLFHSEVNEYDLSKKIRNLEKENEQLKQENKGIQDKVWNLLELLEKENGIDKRKIIDWWNGDVE